MLNTNPLSGFPEQTSVSGWLMIQNSRVLTATTGKKYLSYEGIDAVQQTVKGTLFSDKVLGGELPSMNPGEIWCVSAVVGNGRMGLQLWAESAYKVTEEADVQEFRNLCIPTYPKDKLDAAILKLEEYALSMYDPTLKALSAAIWEYFKPFLYIIPAAKGNHEAYRGGLAKHTLDVLKVVDTPYVWGMGIDYDTLIFSALYHDLGKVRSYTDLIDLTTEGKLVPHAYIALEILTEAITVCKLPVDQTKMLAIRHAIVSHHGPFGEQKPMSREANALHQADMMASRMGHFEEVLKGSIDNTGFSQYSKVLEASAWIPEMVNQ